MSKSNISVPLNWWLAMVRLDDQFQGQTKLYRVASALWYLYGKGRDIQITREIRSQFSVTRQAVNRNLKLLEGAGLIELSIKKGSPFSIKIIHIGQGNVRVPPRLPLQDVKIRAQRIDLPNSVAHITGAGAETVEPISAPVTSVTQDTSDEGSLSPLGSLIREIPPIGITPVSTLAVDNVPVAVEVKPVSASEAPPPPPPTPAPIVMKTTPLPSILRKSLRVDIPSIRRTSLLPEEVAEK